MTLAGYLVKRLIIDLVVDLLILKKTGVYGPGGHLLNAPLAQNVRYANKIEICGVYYAKT
jgi:hypothetical protein